MSDKSPKCPACGERMIMNHYERLDDIGHFYRAAFICVNVLSNPKVHTEYMLAHPEEFQFQT